MLKYLLYPMFGVGVLGMYGLNAATASDVSSVNVRRGQVPASHVGATNYAGAPVLWRTGFHGPSSYVRSSSSSGRGGGYRGGGGYYGGSSWGK